MSPAQIEMPGMSGDAALEQRLVELETRLAFQEHALAELSEALAEARLEIEETPVLMRCPTCGERPVVSLHQLCCAECGAPATELIRGRELDLIALEIEE